MKKLYQFTRKTQAKWLIILKGSPYFSQQGYYGVMAIKENAHSSIHVYLFLQHAAQNGNTWMMS